MIGEYQIGSDEPISGFKPITYLSASDVSSLAEFPIFTSLLVPEIFRIGGAERPINGKEPGISFGDIVSHSFFPDYRLDSDIFWSFIEDANSEAFKIIGAESPVSFFVFPIYNSLSIFGGQLYCTLTDPDDTSFVIRTTFKDVSDKVV
jgi:hypothetical protein